MLGETLRSNRVTSYRFCIDKEHAGTSHHNVVNVALSTPPERTRHAPVVYAMLETGRWWQVHWE